MPLLTQLPPEILHNVLSWVEPQDLLTIPRACRFLYQYIKGNMALARDVYLNFLVRENASLSISSLTSAQLYQMGQMLINHGQDAPPTNDLDWEKEIHDLVRLKAICSRTDVDKVSVLFVMHSRCVYIYMTAGRISNQECVVVESRAALCFQYRDQAPPKRCPGTHQDDALGHSPSVPQR